MDDVKPIVTRQRVLVAITLWLLVALVFPNTVFPNRWFLRFNSQHIHLREVEAHINTIQPAWVEFQKSNPEFAEVRLGAWTGSDGTFGAFGEVWSTNTALSMTRLQTFMTSTKPPRPVYLRTVLFIEATEDDLMEEKKKKSTRRESVTN